MNVSEVSVRRPITGIMIFLALTLLGVYAFTQLKLDMLPDIEFPMVAVITTYTGAGPEEVEQLVTRPIEEAMSSVESVEDVNSQSKDGVSLVLVKFAWGTDMDVAEQNVRKNLEVYADDALPEDVEKPLSFAFDPSMQPVLFMAVNAPGTAQAVRKLADDEIAPYLSRVDGVAAAEVLGGVKREIQVRVRPDWLQAYKIPVSQVVGALRGANVVIPGGNLDQGNMELGITTNAEFTNVDQIRDVVVGQAGGAPVHLRDVAEVADTFEEQTQIVRANSHPAVMIAVRKQSDANTVQVVRKIRAALGKLEAQLPEGVSLTPLFDQAEPITRSISNLASTALFALLFTGAVLLAFLRSWRSSSIALVSIPLSVLATFAVMDFGGVSLNIISMAGLALAVGMLVDNSIVVLENIFQRMEAGDDVKTACIRGTKEVSMPITASTLTTLAVFAPVLFVPGLAGQLFKDMSLTIVISLSASLIVTLTLVPLMASLMLGRKKKTAFERGIAFLTRWLDPLSENYGAFLRKALKHKWKVIGAATLVFFGSMGLATQLGVDFMPKTDHGRLQFNVEAAPGTGLGTTTKHFAQLEEIVRKEVPEAEVTVSQFGAGEGFSALFGNTSYKGTLQIRLPSRSERERSQFEIEDLLRKKFAAVPGLDVKPQPAGMAGMGGDGDVVVKVFSDDMERLRQYGERLKTRIANVKGAADVSFSLEEGRPELQVDLDRDQIKLLGLTPASVAATINTYFMGTPATMYREAGDEYKVLVRAPKAVRENIDRLRNLPVVTPAGFTVPLQTVAHIREGLGPTGIDRENQRRMGTINMNTDGVPLGTLIQRVNDAIGAEGQEPGITTVVAGTAEDLQESFSALGIAILVAILLVYMVMASQFESLLEPFVILFAVPLAAAGVILALLITKTTLQVTALIGMVLLTGVVVNNGIVLIDVLKQRRYEGMDLIEAAVEAGRSRLRPILMTTLTTVLGMLPLAMGWGDGAELWAPMARAVIGGMTLSTLLTLVVVPALYVLIAGWADRRKKRKAEVRAARLAAAEPHRNAA